MALSLTTVASIPACSSALAMPHPPKCGAPSATMTLKRRLYFECAFLRKERMVLEEE